MMATSKKITSQVAKDDSLGVVCSNLLSLPTSGELSPLGTEAQAQRSKGT
jgi:hypothetical protein